MVGLTALWLPILLSAVIAFIASSIIHMVLPWHKGDYPRLAKEDEVRAALGPLDLPPGDYMIPRPANRQDMRSKEFDEKMEKGPVVVMTVLPNGPMLMGKLFVQWFIYLLVVSVFAAYVAGRALRPGEPYLHVFRFAGTTAFLGYALALVQLSIWYRRSWRITLTSMFDGLIYALLTAGTFGWLWPH
jgi:hypothetical protein